MAEDKTINLNIKTNSTDVQKQFDTLRNSIKETEQELEKFSGTEKENSKEADNLRKKLAELDVQYTELSKSNTDLGASFEDIHGEIKPLTAQMGEMEDRLYQMALAGDTASKEYNDLLTEVGKYRKIQMDTDMVVDAAATTMSQKLGGAIQGAASGFALVQGSMALFGTESEELEATLLKVQSAMAITQGLEGLREGAKSFKAMGMAAKTALSGIRKGLIATGIGAAVVALGLIVAYWKDITAFIDAGSSKAKKLNEDYEEGVTLLEAQKKQTDIKLQIMEAEGATAEEIYRVKLKQLDQEIALGKQKVEIAKFEKKNDIERAKRNKKIFDLIITTLLKPLDAIIDAYNYIARKLKWVEMDRISDMISDAVFDINSITNAAQQSVTDAETSLQNLQDQRKLMTVKFNKQQKASAKSSRQTANQRKDDLLAIEREIEDKRSEIRKESEQKEIDLAEREKKRRIEDLKIRLRDDKIDDDQFRKLKVASERKLKKALKDIDDKYRAEELEAERQRLQNLKDIENEFLNELEAETDIANKRLMSEQEFEIQAVEDKYFRLIEMAKQYGLDTEELEANRTAALKEIDDKYTDQVIANNDKKKADDLALYNAQFDMAKNAFSAIGDLATAFASASEESQKRAFEVNKAVSLAQAIMSTAQGIMNELAHPAKVLTFTNYASAAIIAATGAAQIATIARTKFQPSGGGGGGGSAPSAPTDNATASPQPSFNVVGSSGINQLAELQQMPMKAFVVSGDVTTAQSLDRNKIENATI